MKINGTTIYTLHMDLFMVCSDIVVASPSRLASNPDL